MKIRVIDGIPTGSPQTFSENIRLSSDWKPYNRLTEEYDNLRYYPSDRYDSVSDSVVQDLLEIPNYDETILLEIRLVRNRLLQESDWTQLPDSPLSQGRRDLWSTYRQSLRDITESVSSNTSFSDIIWPTKPE
jgi:hypothetical protein